MLQAAHIVIRGRVQGVFFRSEAENLAQKLKLTGWIRNNADGSVESFAQGEAARSKNFWNGAGMVPRLRK